MLNHLDAIETLSALLNSLLEQAKENVKESLENFVGDKVRSLGQAIGGYFDCLNTFNVTKRSELQLMWKTCYQNKDIRESVDNLLEVEEDWDDFLKVVDEKLGGGGVTDGRTVTVGSVAPLKIPLVNIDTGRYRNYFRCQDNIVMLRTMTGRQFRKVK